MNLSITNISITKVQVEVIRHLQEPLYAHVQVFDQPSIDNKKGHKVIPNCTTFRIKYVMSYTVLVSCADQEGSQGSGSTLKNHKTIGFLSNTGPDPLKNSQRYQASNTGQDPLKNHKATKPAILVRIP